MILGTHLSELLSDIALRSYTSEAEYQKAIEDEHKRLLAENRSSMSSDDIEMLESTKAVLFWSYSKYSK